MIVGFRCDCESGYFGIDCSEGQYIILYKNGYCIGIQMIFLMFYMGIFKVVYIENNLNNLSC